MSSYIKIDAKELEGAEAFAVEQMEGKPVTISLFQQLIRNAISKAAEEEKQKAI